MSKQPIEVSGLRKAPAIVVNRGDWIQVGQGWYKVIDYTNDPHVVVVEASNDILPFHVDAIQEWRKG